MAGAPPATPLDTYGLSGQPFDYGMGAGWLPFMNQRDQLLASLYLGQGGLGQGLLGTLQNLLTNPTGGPLGLAATAQYGGPQGIASGTGGAGIDNSAWTSLFDRLLQGLSGAVMNPGSPFNPDNGGQFNTDAAPIAPKVDPNNAPAPSPTNAAQAPNAGPNLYELFNMSNSDPSRSSGQWFEDLKKWGEAAGAPGAKHGGIVKVPGYEEGGLVGLAKAADSAGLSGEQREQWLNSLRTINSVGQHIASMTRADSGKSDWMLKQVAALAGNAGIEPTFQGSGPDGYVTHNYLGSGAQLDDPSSWDPRFLRAMLAQYPALYPEVQDDTPSRTWRKMPMPDFGKTYIPPAPMAGGGMVIGGQPHYVVDSSGYPVAALTEDGKPEQLDGVGGMEVTPLDPMRNMLYEARKAKMGSHAMTLSGAESELKSQMPQYETGGDLLFPYVPNSLVNSEGSVGQGPGTSMIPTMGGPAGGRREATGAAFVPEGDDYSSIMASIGKLPGTYNQRYAKLLGGALDSNQAIPAEQLRALNEGKAPSQLFSSQALSTMSPSQRLGYAEFLKQMGIIQSTGDLEYYVKQFTPTALS